MRDGEKDKFLGRGVLKAVANVNDKLADELCGMDALDQAGLDYRMIELDGTETKEAGGQRHPGHLAGRRPCRGRITAACRLYRYLGGVGARVLPAPDDEHPQRRQARRQRVDVQEFMVMPLGFDCFSDAIRCGVRSVSQPQEGAAARRSSTPTWATKAGSLPT